MPPQDEGVPPVVDRIQRLGELSHELSNTLGTSISRISLAVLRDGKDIPEDLLIAVQEALRANETLRALMCELHELHGQIIGTRQIAPGALSHREKKPAAGAGEGNQHLGRMSPDSARGASEKKR